MRGIKVSKINTQSIHKPKFASMSIAQFPRQKNKMVENLLIGLYFIIHNWMSGKNNKMGLLFLEFDD